MNPRILITGSSGLVGSALESALDARRIEVISLDSQATGSDAGDVRDIDHVCTAVARCDGVVHLAAVYRVLWGELDPELCRAANVGGLRNIIQAIHLTLREGPTQLINDFRDELATADAQVVSL